MSMLLRMKPSSGKFSVDPGQNRDLMSGKSFLHAQNGGKIKLQVCHLGGQEPELPASSQL